MWIRLWAGMTVLYLGACQSVPGTGCYAFDWSEYSPKDAVPMWVVPDGVRLEAIQAADGRSLAGPRNPAQAPAPASGGAVGPWDTVLYDRTWTMADDTIDLLLKDLGYHEWHIRLVPTPGGWRGQAIYTTTVGGGQWSYPGVIEAFSCTGE